MLVTGTSSLRTSAGSHRFVLSNNDSWQSQRISHVDDVFCNLNAVLYGIYAAIVDTYVAHELKFHI